MEELKNKILKAFKQYVRENGEYPKSVFTFMTQLGHDEREFYNVFSTFEAVEAEVWSQIFDQTHEKLISEEVYSEYIVREKLLAFYFTLVEVLKENRSFLVAGKKSKLIQGQGKKLKHFLSKFKEYAERLLDEGIENEEIEQRMVLSNHYDKMLRWQTSYLINFWLNDQTDDFEDTDAAIEKAVNFVMDALGKNIVDSGFDLGRFLIRNRK